MSSTENCLPIIRRKNLLLTGVIEEWSMKALKHFNLFNKLKDVSAGGENMLDHIVKNYVEILYLKEIGSLKIG